MHFKPVMRLFLAYDVEGGSAEVFIHSADLRNGEPLAVSMQHAYLVDCLVEILQEDGKMVREMILF